jgi:hypothetical protein
MTGYDLGWTVEKMCQKICKFRHYSAIGVVTKV